MSHKNNAGFGGTVNGTARILLLYNPKGGVGKTTIAMNLALAVRAVAADDNLKIALLDFDVSGANLSSVVCRLPLDEVRHRNIARWKHLYNKNVPGQSGRDLVFSSSSGIDIAAAPLNYEDGFSLSYGEADAVLKYLAARYDVLIVDGGPGLSDAVDMALHHATDIIAVTNGEGQSLAQLSKLISAFKCPEGFTLNVSEDSSENDLRSAMKERLSKLRIVLNHTSPPSKYSLNREDVQSALGILVTAEIPFCDRIVESLHGKEDISALNLDKGGAFSKAMMALAVSVCQYNGCAFIREEEVRYERRWPTTLFFGRRAL